MSLLNYVGLVGRVGSKKKNTRGSRKKIHGSQKEIRGSPKKITSTVKILGKQPRPQGFTLPK